MIFHKQTEQTLIKQQIQTRQLVQDLPDLGLLFLQKVLKGVSMRQRVKHRQTNILNLKFRIFSYPSILTQVLGAQKY